MTFSVKYVWQWLLDNFRCTNIATNANQVSMHAAALSSKTKCNMFLRIESLVHFKETKPSIAPFLKKIYRYLGRYIHRKCIKHRFFFSNDGLLYVHTNVCPESWSRESQCLVTLDQNLFRVKTLCVLLNWYSITLVLKIPIDLWLLRPCIVTLL